jgi:type IV secretion system protein VirB8
MDQPTIPPPEARMIAPPGYYADAASWSEDVNAALRTSRSRAWWVAGVAAFLAVVQGIALVLLVPLKTVVPYTITVDRQTGYAQLARGVDLGPLSESDSLVQAALAQYVIARETLDAADIAANYRKVGLWSTGDARRTYLRAMDRSNPDSVLQSANAATQVSTIVKSIAILDKTSALVRFSTDRRDGDGPIFRRDWAAVVKFGFTGGPLSMEDRLINPLGFQVDHYRRDAETAAPTIIAPGSPAPSMIAPGSPAPSMIAPGSPAPGMIAPGSPASPMIGSASPAPGPSTTEVLP